MTDKPPTLEDAIALAARAHAGQLDKAGQPYILHPIRVMLRLPDATARIVAILHDTVEDTDVTFEQLRAAGYGAEILSALDSVTRRADETYEDFVQRSAADPIGRRVKLADLADNMDLRRLPIVKDKDADRLERYQRAWSQLMAIEEAARAE
jgi:(p)ppGpp synthase/HD superfamily hydrolase